MSAWLCENKLLSLVVDVVKSNSFRYEYDICNDYSDKSEQELMEILHEINAYNLEYLYPDDVDFRTLDNIGYVKQDVSDVQKHKSVASFIYQSCDVYEEGDNKLYDLLCEWTEDYREIYEGDEWENAHWDIDAPLN